jgi:prevent-host-death family protein
MITVTSAEAQGRLAELLERVEDGAVTIVEGSRTLAFLVSLEDMQELLDSRRIRAQTVADFAAWSERAKERATPEAAALTDEEVNRLVHELR